MGKGQNEGGFSDEQIQMYKDCFKLMDINKDGQLDKNDLRGAFDNVGVLMTEGELDSLLGEVGVIMTQIVIITIANIYITIIITIVIILIINMIHANNPHHYNPHPPSQSPPPSLSPRSPAPAPATT